LTKWVNVLWRYRSGAGLKNDVIVGFPAGADPLGAHVVGPAAVWSQP
jgi:hypothetical protein